MLGDLPPVQGTDGGPGHTTSMTGTTSTTSTTGTTGTTGTTSTTGATGTGGMTGTTSATGTGGGCCDCDHDGHLSQALCGGDDCDDDDPLVHPGQKTYFATPSKNPNVGFDYDCNGSPDPEFPGPIDCSAIKNGDCDAGVGFLKAVPPCGDAGSWGSCVDGTIILTCAQHVIDANKVSRCR